MSEAREREWRELFAFFEFWETHWRPPSVSRDHPAHPLNYINVVIAKCGRSKALDGLKQAVGDILEKTSDLRSDSLRQLDAALVSKGIVSLSTLRRRYRAKYQAVLKRGRIRSETEYHLIKGAACDQSVPISEHERRVLDRLLHAFESGAA